MATIIRRHPRKLVAGIVLVGVGYGVAEGILPNPLQTSGVQNIEQRYSSGGGSKNHLPGAATKRGHPDSVEGNTETAKGIGSPHHEANYQEQKPDTYRLMMQAAFDEKNISQTQQGEGEAKGVTQQIINNG
ncbi:hypothetical protein HO133_008665 [Letharia lupina]|uniref:Uncharacterized protein n=1 Tax=Letharia lupina TaxID=560253 RepID=A0A8H6FGP4_9LECA|nr:uncharacterized protein HO133_008665 [Letharia lupina]KAF6227223.1 hypothetical protein HO133_008665 [Letharia lupina]